MTDTATNVEAILIGLLSVAHTPEQAAHAAKEVLRQHAEQLADRQRKHFIPRQPGWTAEYIRGLDDGLDAAADLIRPEAQR
ncbi:hypothetical protein OOK29_09570 [Streptomyces phaeochromogenes]|uniref:hypothetical protein n=1 Tax=Streptomyces phaeochromogenes TaxID=1923 RepID=UPI00224D3BBC|nr:hypothetical protein [Streptomyces phaeochromogenes]MCX5598385.1 hypothetical protein [Streptomyces phaeochromogenes]